ncbi:MAG: hypothetical protein AAGN82_24370 [Myxococcota bacterium]
MTVGRWCLLATLGLGCGGTDGTGEAAAGGDDATTMSAISSATGGGGQGAGGSFGGGGAGGEAGTGGGEGGAGGQNPTVPQPGFGALSGDCGVLEPNALVTGAPPTTWVNALDFGSATYDASLLSPGAQTIIAEGTSGGSSSESEAIAFDVLFRCELAALLKSETEIGYVPPDSVKTDFLAEIDGMNIGVSVVRAFAFMSDYTVPIALAAMNDKLGDIQVSSANVVAADAWSKQILAVVAEKPENAAAIQAALVMVDPGVRGDTIVVVTVTNGEDAFLY